MTLSDPFVIKNATSITHFIDTFGTLHDAVVHQIKLNLFSPDYRNKSVEIVLGAIRWDIDVENFRDRWVNLNMRFTSVQEFEITQARRYTIAVIFEAVVGLVDDGMYVDFFKDSALPEKLAIESENEEHTMHRNTALRIVAERCDWWMTPYNTVGDEPA